jgi:quinol monooxygenase YgiN
VVAGVPDEVHGALAHAFVEFKPGTPGSAAAHFRAFVNAQVPYYQGLYGVHRYAELPRSANGKISRRLLVEHLARTDSPENPTEEQQMVTLVNVFTAHVEAEEFERVFAASSEFMCSQPGFLDHCLGRSLRRPGVYVNIAHWTDAAAHRKVVQSEGFRTHIAELSRVAKVEPDLYTPVLEAERV